MLLVSLTLYIIFLIYYHWIMLLFLLFNFKYFQEWSLSSKLGIGNMWSKPTPSLSHPNKPQNHSLDWGHIARVKARVSIWEMHNHISPIKYLLRKLPGRFSLNRAVLMAWLYILRLWHWISWLCSPGITGSGCKAC